MAVNTPPLPAAALCCLRLLLHSRGHSCCPELTEFRQVTRVIEHVQSSRWFDERQFQSGSFRAWFKN